MADARAKETPITEAAVQDQSEWQKLIQGRTGVKTAEATTEIDRAAKTLAEVALENATLVSDDAEATLKALIAKLDEKLTAQVNAILHHEDFRALEGAWRGLHYLVSNTETDDQLKIKVLNLSKTELSKTLKKFKGAAWDTSPIFKKVYGGYNTFGGDPFGCVLGDFYFDNTAPDVETLGEMAKIAASAHCPFISAAAPTMMQMDSWQELANPRDLKKVQDPKLNPEYAAYQSLRESEDARYLGLCLPRFLARLPYGAKTNPVDEFDFEEETEAGKHDRYVWANSAYAMGANINRSFKQFGWCASIRGVENGGIVEGLPVHTFPTDDGGVDMKCPTEIAIDDRREKELADLGLMPILHKQNTDIAAFIGAQSMQKPTEYDDPDANDNAKLSARLPYLFAACRFAHYLKSMVRDKIGSFKERGEMEVWLNNWIGQYVLRASEGVTDAQKARQPLAGAEVVVEEIEGNPGAYSAKFFLRPHYQLEVLKTSLRLVAKLPSQKK